MELEPTHLRWQSVLPEWMPGDANISIHMETQGALQPQVCQEEIKMLIIDIQLSPSPQPGYDL